METHAPEETTGTASLEAVELELVLGLTDLTPGTFDESMKSVARQAGGELLFAMPAAFVPACSCVAAVSIGGTDTRQIVLVTLEEDGKTVRTEKSEDSSSPFAGLARSYVHVMEQMPAIAA